MSWFWLALISPILYAVTNHIDKHLLDRYFKSGGVGTLLLVSALFSGFVIPVTVLADPTVLAVDVGSIITLVVVGLFDIGVVWFYLLSLRQEDASVTVVYYQLVPVFGLLFGYLFLGEEVGIVQLVAMAVIICGTTLVALELDTGNGFRFRWRTVLFMSMACICWALQTTILKYVALDEDVWRSLFWKYLVMFFVGILIFCFGRSYRQHFLHALRSNTRAILTLNFANEAIYVVGAIVAAFAAMLAPVAMVLLANSFQSIFVLTIGVLVSAFYPNLIKEETGRIQTQQKVVAIVLTGIGTYLLLTSHP